MPSKRSMSVLNLLQLSPGEHGELLVASQIPVAIDLLAGSIRPEASFTGCWAGLNTQSSGG